MSSVEKSTETPTDEPGAPSPMTPHERLAEIHSLLGQVLSTATSHDMLDLAMATAISQRVVPDGPPVWLLFEGAPSSGKTSVVNLLKVLSAKPDPLVVLVPKITLGSLTSGYKETSKDRKGSKRATPLLKEFHTRCWGNTEFSTLLTGKPDAVKEIIGTLLSAFDGELRASFGNVTEQDSAVLPLESRFSILGCITPEARQDHARLLTRLGPRFLSYRLLTPTDEERQRAYSLVGDPQREARLKELGTLITVHAQDVLKARLPVTIPEDTDRVLRTLSELVATGRTPVVGAGDDLTVEGGEDSIRAYQQLRGLALSLAVIHGTPVPSPRALRLVRDVALSSFEPRRAEVLMAQRTNPVLVFWQSASGAPITWVHGLTVSRIAEETGWSTDTAGRVLRELTVLGLYVRAEADWKSITEPGPGPSPQVYLPTPGLMNLMNATFEDYPFRLVTMPALALDREGAFPSRLSLPDARLATEVVERRVERDCQLRESAARLLQEHPDLDPDDLVLRMIREVTGLQLVPAEDASPGVQIEGERNVSS